MKNIIIVIGNGFDIWQGLNTQYAEFSRYYYGHRKSIAKKLFVRPHKIMFDKNTSKELFDVEIIYGNPFSPQELSSSFWNTFEDSLAVVDDELINLFFGKEPNDLRRLSKSTKAAKKMLRTAFVDWIRTIEICEKENNHFFDETCTFLNFNYTDTLQKRFGVADKDIFYIHGRATDKNSIVFGHSEHPEPPPLLAKKFGGRFEGLYYIEKLLYETDKHATNNLYSYIEHLAMMNIFPQDIHEVYVLGHSFGQADYEYFRFLIQATQETSIWHVSCYSEEDKSRVNKVMSDLNFNNYRIYSSIDDCIDCFRINTSQ